MTAQADHLANKKLNLEKATNFMRQYRDPHSRELKKLSANQFMEVWSHYDKDGNGYIEGTELDGFLREFVSSANITDIAPEVVSSSITIFLFVYAHLITFQAVSDEMLVELKACFMEAYDDNQDGKIDIREVSVTLSLLDSFKIWREYDTDGSGYIEADELKLQVFDSNKDGRLQLSEMAK
ncbi:calbindin [Holotrichia oblita]|uniref:Calbindin n=1 Tax=Holotrichia oblita TaxID=644536 RepID=A0ACB9TPJ7_HOLOL|nr:calbindin [Holotrichia oblita]